MIIDDAFEVDAPVERVWALLKDIPKVATCAASSSDSITIVAR